MPRAIIRFVTYCELVRSDATVTAWLAGAWVRLRSFVQGTDALQSIIEEGFQATFSGSNNGDVHGAGIYFATEAVLADMYVQAETPDAPRKIIMARIVPGTQCGALECVHAAYVQFVAFFF